MLEKWCRCDVVVCWCLVSGVVGSVVGGSDFGTKVISGPPGNACATPTCSEAVAPESLFLVARLYAGSDS